MQRKNSRESHHRYHSQPPRVEQPVDFNATLHDFIGANYEFYNITDAWTSNVEETPYDCAKKIYEVIVKNGDHMYPGNTKYTRLNYTKNLLKFKNYSHCSNRAFDSLLILFMDITKETHIARNLLWYEKRLWRICGLS